jgi:DNA ligase-1
MKPMLAGKCEDMSALTYPVMASHKLDGVRALIIGGIVMSRTLKPIPNAWVQKTFSKLPEGTDGELIFGDPTHPDAYRNTVSAVMREDGEPTQVNYHVFDNFTDDATFFCRYNNLVNTAGGMGVVVVKHVVIKSLAELEAYEAAAVEAGHEGIMVRAINGPYKQGRSTAKEGWLLKVKRFEDSEAVVLGTEEYQNNTNAAFTNELGRTARSSEKAGKVGAGVLGKLLVEGLEGTYAGVEFSIGTGFSGADSSTGERAKLWAMRDKLIGRVAKFKYFATGGKDKPRFPVFLGWRDKIDM